MLPSHATFYATLGFSPFFSTAFPKSFFFTANYIILLTPYSTLRNLSIGHCIISFGYNLLVCTAVFPLYRGMKIKWLRQDSAPFSKNWILEPHSRMRARFNRGRKPFPLPFRYQKLLIDPSFQIIGNHRALEFITLSTHTIENVTSSLKKNYHSHALY